jgi:hypothetical protein
MPNPLARGPYVDVCSRLLIQYIRSYPPYLETVSSIRNLRSRLAVVTRDPANLCVFVSICIYVYCLYLHMVRSVAKDPLRYAVQ